MIANRGEIALRIIRTLREMGIQSVAVYSDADADALFVLEADEAYRIGPAPAPDSYLNRSAILEAAEQAGADAIHPGYGFWAENPEFAEAVAASGLTFIGPSPSSMRLMGDKIAARRTATKVDVPLVPGTEDSVTTADEARQFVTEHGLPVLVKAGGGGGGRGIRVVMNGEELEEALERASSEAATYFKNPDVYLERFFSGARHIEVQIAGDAHGVVKAWGERDCSTQRRRQKLIEETPAPGLAERDRQKLFDYAIKLAAEAGYVGVGTVEFLYAGEGQVFFLEMNTRVQVEHTITEEVTGLDLIRESIQLAAGEPASDPPSPRGHAIEARINAEDPARNFRPGSGLLRVYREPGGMGVRVDSGVYQGFVVPSNYDSLIAKLVVHASDRDLAMARLLRALREFRVEGIPTTIPLISSIVSGPTFSQGDMTADWLDSHLDQLSVGPEFENSSPVESDGYRALVVEVNGKRFAVRTREETVGKKEGPRARLTRSNRPQANSNSLVSPMHGTVMVVRKQAGDSVEQGEAVFVIEAMKMENEVTAPRAGIIAKILVMTGATIEVNQTLAELEPIPARAE